MDSQTIFRYYASTWNRYGELEDSEICISANFDDPAAWPFTLKRFRYENDECSFEQEKILESEIKLPKALFCKLKGVIEMQGELSDCPRQIDNQVMDGTDETFYFVGDGFYKEVFGLCIYSTGAYEEQGGCAKTWNNVVYRAVKKIEDTLAEAGLALWG